MNKEDEVVREVEKMVRKILGNSTKCHDWTHTQRVRIIALKIGKAEGADLEVIELAALLHDICKKEESKKGEICHAEKGAEKANEMLKELGVDNSVVENVCEAIKSHKFNGKHKPKTIEAKAVYDADRLDALGAIGIIRDFIGSLKKGVLYTGKEKDVKWDKKSKKIVSGEHSAFAEYESGVKRYMSENMLTEAGKMMATQRFEFMKKFFKRFWLEVEGKQ